MKYLLVCIPFILPSCEKKQITSISPQGVSSSKEDKSPTSVVNQLPATGLKDPPWTSHICHICMSKDFGCYPKSTSKGVRTDAGLKCIHKWTRVTKEEFAAYQVKDQVVHQVSNGKTIKSSDTDPLYQNQ